MQEFTAIGVMVVVVTVLWRLLGYVADRWIKKDDSRETETGAKLDTIMQMIHDQNIKMSEMNSALNHGLDIVRKVEEREYQLRGKVSTMETKIAVLEEWKKYHDKQG